MEGSTSHPEPAVTGGTAGEVGPTEELHVTLPQADVVPPAGATKQEPMEFEERVVGEVIMVKSAYL